MKSIYLVFSVFFFTYCHGGIITLQKDGDDECDCDFKPDQSNPWDSQLIIPGSINDDVENEEIFNVAGCKNFDKKDITCTSVSSCYFDAVMQWDDDDGTSFKIVTNENLKKIDGDYSNIQGSTKDVLSTFTFSCSGNEKKLGVKVTVKDTNNHPPTFSANQYEFTVPMPMPAEIDLAQFGEEIKIQDLDFTNSQITLSSEDAESKGIHIDFNPVAFETDSKRLNYDFKLKFKEFTKLTEDVTFQLTAQDSGDPPQYSVNSVKVTIKVDTTNSGFEPKFIEASYSYKYDSESGKIQPLSGNPKLEESYEGLTCQMEGDMKDIFNDPEITDGEIELSLKDKLSSTKVFSIATLSCFKSTTIKGSTDIIISNTNSYTFTDKLYTAKLTKEGIINMEEGMVKITGNGEDDLVLDMDPTYADYFQMVKIDNSNYKLALNSEKKLDENILNDISLGLLITLKNKDGDSLDSSVILLYLPNGENGLKFAQPYFEGKYTVDKNGKVDFSLDPISFNTDEVDIQKYSLGGTYSENFEVEKDGNNLQITKKTDLPSDALKNDHIPLTLQAQLGIGSAGSQNVETTVLINLNVESDDGGNTDDCDCSSTGWIVATVILIICMVAYVGGTIFYYFKKLKN